jgi:hypothetical protein
MNAVPFDTLRMAQRLEAAGFAAPQAAGAAEALAEALIGADLATKGDITGLKSDIAALRTKLEGDITALRTEMMSALELLRRDMTIKLGGMIFVAVGVLLAAMRYMPPHP